MTEQKELNLIEKIEEEQKKHTEEPTVWCALEQVKGYSENAIRLLKKEICLRTGNEPCFCCREINKILGEKSG